MKLTLARGTFRVIRTDGSEELIHERPTMRLVCQMMKCAESHSLILERENNGDLSLVMLVDQDHASKGSPANAKADAIARAYYGPQYRHQICGDVVIADDRDF